jgi:hypothetical protein
MGSVTILCPRTGQQVPTGIKMTRYEFDEMPIMQTTMHCWACGGEHTWSKRWATFVEDRDATPDLDLSAPYVRRARELFRTR